MNTSNVPVSKKALDRANLYLSAMDNPVLYASIFRLPIAERIIYGHAIQGIIKLLAYDFNIPLNTVSYRYKRAKKRINIYLIVEAQGWKVCEQYIKSLQIKQEYRDTLIHYFYCHNTSFVAMVMNASRSHTVYTLKLAVKSLKNNNITAYIPTGIVNYNMQKWFKQILKNRRELSSFGDLLFEKRLKTYYSYNDSIDINKIIHGDF